MPRNVDHDPNTADVSHAFVASRLRMAGIAVLGAKIALVPLIFDLSLDAPLSVPKALVSHSLAIVLLGVIGALLLRFGRRFLVWSPLHAAVLVFFAANVLAAIFARDSYVGLYGTHIRMLGLATIADWVVLYFSVVLLACTRKDAIVLIACALGASVLVLLYAIIQLAGLDPFSWTFNGQLSPFSTFGQPTILAQYLMIVAMLTFALAIVTPIHRTIRFALVAYSGILLAVAATTGTRSSAVGVAAGAATLVILTWILYPMRRARIISVAAGISAVIAMSALLILTPIGTRLSSSLEGLIGQDAQGDLLSRLEPSTAARVALYTIGLEIVRESPLLGYGPDNFVVGVPRYRTDQEPREIQSSLATSAHSWVGYVATSSGILGLAAFLAVIAIAALLTVRGGFRPLSIAALTMLSAFLGGGLTTVSDIGTDWLFWAGIGAVAAVTAQSTSVAPVVGLKGAQSVRRRPSGTSTASNVGALALVALAVLSASASLGAWDASRSARRSQDQRLVGQSAAAIQAGIAATRADPGRADYWHALGLAYVSATRIADATAAFERASNLVPYDVRLMGDYTRAFLLQGDQSARTKALTLADQAVRIDPNNPLAQLTRAIALQASGNSAGALQPIEKAVALDPLSTNPALWIAAAQINLALGRASEAERLAGQGVAQIGEGRNSVGVRYERARALVALGRQRDALDVLNFLLSIQAYLPAEQLRTTIQSAIGN